VCCCCKCCAGWRSCWVEWSKCFHLACPAQALVHALVTTDPKTHRGLRPSCHRRMGPWGWAIYLVHDDIPKATNSNNISIRTTKEMEKYESLHHQEFVHTHVYDVNLLERVCLDEELTTILRTVGGGKHDDEPRLGSSIESEPPPLPSTLTGMLLWSGTSVMALTRLCARCKQSDDSSIGWMTLHTCKQRYMTPSTHRPLWRTTSLVALGLTLMQRFKLGGGVGCPGMSLRLSHFVPSFSSYLVTCLACWLYHYHCHDC
jgi:hypothetical protein